MSVAKNETTVWACASANGKLTIEQSSWLDGNRVVLTRTLTDAELDRLASMVDEAKKRRSKKPAPLVLPDPAL